MATTLKLSPHSDTHLEFKERSGWLPAVPIAADVIVLAGDIDVGDYAAHSVEKVASYHMDKHVIYVGGNHEYYHQNLTAQLDRYRKFFAPAPKIHFLENDTVAIDGVRFLGCTLWSDFRALEPDVPGAIAATAAKRINDFRLITVENSPITPSAMATRNAASVYWLEQELKKGFNGKTVIVTHFPPCKTLRHGRIPVDTLSPYFLNNLEWLIEKYRPSVWIYGHNHWNDDTVIHDCRVVSNQLGYPFENQVDSQYRKNLLIEV